MSGVLFMGSGAFAVPALERLATLGETVPAVYTQPPRPAERGQRLRRTPVHEAAERLGLEVRTPRTLRTPEVQAEVRAHGAELALVAAYGLLLPQPVLDAPARGCFNLHASILPRWRGAAPIQRAIQAGDATTGVTLFRMEAGLDTGPVLLTRETAIGADETAGDLHDRLAGLAADMVDPFLKGMRDGSLRERDQPEVGATYARKLDKAEAALDLRRPAPELVRLVRALSPWPGAFVRLDGERLVLRRVQAVGGKGEPGEVVGAPLDIATGEGALRVLEAQRPGRRSMAAEDLLRGWKLPAGARFASGP